MLQYKNAIFQVIAEDPDSPEITRLRYSLDLGNEDQALAIDADSGAIYVQDPLGMGPRRVMVTVDDGLHQAKT